MNIYVDLRKHFEYGNRAKLQAVPNGRVASRFERKGLCGYGDGDDRWAGRYVGDDLGM